MKQLLVLVFALGTSFAANAQDVGFLAGIGQTSADTSTLSSGTSVDSEIGWRLGVAVRLDLMDQFSFRTGGTYTSRPVTVDTGLTGDLKVKMAYIDIPALFQFNLNDMVAFYAGPVIGIKANEKATGAGFDGDVSDLNPGHDAKGIYLLGQIGANFNFDGVGFDVYYEQGFGDIVEDTLKDYSIVGANFVYWF
jgi:hypothetical protein